MQAFAIFLSSPGLGRFRPRGEQAASTPACKATQPGINRDRNSPGITR